MVNVSGSYSKLRLVALCIGGALLMLRVKCRAAVGLFSVLALGPGSQETFSHLLIIFLFIY